MLLNYKSFLHAEISQIIKVSSSLGGHSTLHKLQNKSQLSSMSTKCKFLFCPECFGSKQFFLCLTSISFRQVIHSEDSKDWILKIKYAQVRDSGNYECQISTRPVKSYIVRLNVFGE